MAERKRQDEERRRQEEEARKERMEAVNIIARIFFLQLFEFQEKKRKEEEKLKKQAQLSGLASNTGGRYVAPDI